MKTTNLWIVIFASSVIAIGNAYAQLPSVKWTVPPLPNSQTSDGWLNNYSGASSRYYVVDTVSLQIMDGPFSTTPSITITFDKSHNEGGEWSDIPDVTGDGVKDISVLRERPSTSFGPPVRYGFRIVDGATANTVWVFDEPSFLYQYYEAVDLDHDGKIELVVGKLNPDFSNVNTLVYATNGIALSAPQQSMNIPASYEIKQNYPNPFNPSTTIQYQLSVREDANITIYDNLGREVKRFSLGLQEAGTHSLRWDGKNELGASVASGIYYYKARIGTFVQSKKMVIVK